MANSVEIIIKALDATKGGFNSALRNVKSFSAAATSLASVAATAAVAAGGAYVAMAKTFADSADELGKLSQKTGISTEELSKLKFVAEENSIEWGVFQKELRAASDEAAKSGQSFNQLLSSQADRFASFADGAGKTAEALRIFGKSGADLIPLLNLGSKGLADATREAERFTTIIDSQTAATADEFGDTLERVGKTIKKALNDGLKEAMPYMLQMSRSLLEMVDLMRDADGSFTTFGQTVMQVGKGLAITAQIGANAATSMVNLGKMIYNAFTGATAEKGVSDLNKLLEDAGDGWYKLKSIWEGDIKLPTPKVDSAKLPEMTNSKDSEKLQKMYEDLVDSQFRGSLKLTREFDSAHKHRMDQVLEMQVSVEEGARFEELSARIAEQQKSEIYATGIAQRADMDSAYQFGRIQQNEIFLKSESAAQLASLENNRAIIDIQVQQWKAASESFRVQWAKVGVSIQEGALSGVQRGMEGIIKGTMKASEAMKALGQAIIDSVVAAFSQMIAKLLIMKTLGFIFGGGGFLGDLFGFKDGGFAGGKGFASGGFTGNGGTGSIAGVVHKGEYVLPARTTAAIGVQELDAIKDSGDVGAFGGFGQMATTIMLDGQVLARSIGLMSRNGLLELSAGSVV